MSHLEEWKVARDVIAKGDERIHDLRKYGLTFISGLLTADAFLFHKEAIDNWAAIGGCLVALVLLVTLRTVERQQQLLQQVAASRAIVLERSLNLELTDVISDRYAGQRWHTADFLVYLGFAAATLLVMLTVDHNWIMWSASIVVFAAATLVFGLLLRTRVIYARGTETDWSFDRIECPRGEGIVITFMNLSDTAPAMFKAGEVAWVVIGITAKYRKEWKPDADLIVAPGDTYSWIWDDPNAEKGLYSFELPYGAGTRGLRRKLRIQDSRTPQVIPTSSLQVTLPPAPSTQAQLPKPSPVTVQEDDLSNNPESTLAAYRDLLERTAAVANLAPRDEHWAARRDLVNVALLLLCAGAVSTIAYLFATDNVFRFRTTIAIGAPLVLSAIGTLAYLSVRSTRAVQRAQLVADAQALKARIENDVRRLAQRLDEGESSIEGGS